MFIEDVFITNTLCDFAILFAVKKLLNKKTKYRFLILGSLLGGIQSLVSYYYSILILNILFGILLVSCVFGYKSLNEFIKVTASFFSVSFCLAGMIRAVDISTFPVLLFIICSILCYIILSIVDKNKNEIEKQDIIDIEINLFNKTKKLRALQDTGNLTGAIITEYKAIKEILPKEFCESYEQDDEYYSLLGKYKFDIIPMQTVGGTELLLAIPDKDRKIAICRKRLSQTGDFQAIV
jgi:hypothetical protein